MTKKIRKLASLTLAITIILAGGADAESSGNDNMLPHRDVEVIALSIDNDVFVPTATDRDFTAGFALTHSGRPILKRWRSVDGLVGKLDTMIGVNRDAGTSYTPSIEIGGYGFTPDNIEASEILADDRPYASLVYLSASRAYMSDDGRSAWTSSLSVGVLGLNVFETAQNAVHGIVGSPEAEGWDHQIADGGEPTFRYQAAYHNYWRIGSQSPQFKTTYFGSAGYLTEAGLAISTRGGRIASPDYRFNPELITYGERVNETLATPYAGKEHYFWGGIALKARLYNVFLQGQFRDSDHTLGGSDLESLIVEGWLGYTRSLGKRFKLSYVIRAQTSEIRQGAGDRSMLWGGVVLSKSLSP